MERTPLIAAHSRPVGVISEILHPGERQFGVYKAKNHKWQREAARVAEESF